MSHYGDMNALNMEMPLKAEVLYRCGDAVVLKLTKQQVGNLPSFPIHRIWLLSPRNGRYKMTHDTHIYGEVNSRTGLQKVFREIRQDIGQAKSRPALTELYKRAGYMITLTNAPSWRKKFGREAAQLRQVAEKEFTTTARKVNSRAKAIGTEADYDNRWGH